MTLEERAHLIATDRGESRDHERRVAELIHSWTPHTALTLEELDIALAGAWLHALPHAELDALPELGVPTRTVEAIGLIHPPDNEFVIPAFYRAVEKDPIAIVLIAADRCAHLEEARRDLDRGQNANQWARYVRRALRELHYLPWPSPFFAYELNGRVRAVEATLPDARGVA